jgi:hypothetical protein
MTGRSNLRNLGRAVLMGTAVGLSAGGCTIPFSGIKPLALQTSQIDEDYSEALAARSPSLVTTFIRNYRSSPRSATLLNQMPSSVLAGIPRSAVMSLDNDVKQRLSARVRAHFRVAAARRDLGGGGFGYNG